MAELKTWPAPTFLFCASCGMLRAKAGQEPISEHELRQLRRNGADVIEETCLSCRTAAANPPKQLFAAAGGA